MWFVMLALSWRIQRKTSFKIGNKLDKLHLKIKKNTIWSLLKKDRAKSSTINQNLYFIFGNIVLKFEMDPNNKTKAIEQKPYCLWKHTLICACPFKK